MPRIDFYLEYSAWFLFHYGRPFTATREEWDCWCKAQPSSAQSDIDFDYSKEREGDAQ